MKSFIKRAVAVIMAIALLSSFSVCFAAQQDKVYEHYDKYVLLGDSVAAGHNDLVKRDTEFKRVEESYAAIVADTLGAELLPYACNGFRTTELRYLLEDDFEPDEYLFHDVERMTHEEVIARIPEIKAAIASADLITLGIGGNDFGTYTSWIVLDILEKEGALTPFVKAARKYLEDNNIENDTLNSLIDLADTMDALPELMKAIPEAIKRGKDALYANWDPMIEDIRALNPDATMLVIGMFDTGLKGEPDPDESEQAAKLKSELSAAILGISAKPMIEGAAKYGYAYVETDGTVCDTFHPTDEGYRHIANRILEALPDARYPYKDVKFGTTYYKSVVKMTEAGIMDGTSSTTFSPDAALTKADLAKALYAIAGSPDKGESKTFNDVTAADSRLDAITWAVNNGLLAADRKGNFAPNAKVNMLVLSTVLLKFSAMNSSGIIDTIKAIGYSYNLLKDCGRENLLKPVTRAQAAMIFYDYSGK